MALDDFYKALGMFQEATKDYAVKQGINDATKAVQDLNQSLDMDINQKYAQQQAISKQLATHLTGLGAPQSAIATAVGAIAPPDITTVEGARQLAAQATTPDERLKYAKVAEENAAKLGESSLATKEPQLKQEQGFKAAESQKDRDLQWAIANLQARNKAAKPGRALPSEQLTKLSAASATIESLAGLKAQLTNMKDEIGPVSGIDITKSWTNPEFAAFKSQVGQTFDQYRNAVTGAGASGKELEILQKNTPTVRDPYDVFQAKLLRWEDTVKRIENRRMENLRKLGYDLGEMGPYELVSKDGVSSEFKPYYVTTPGGRTLLVKDAAAEKEIQATGIKVQRKE